MILATADTNPASGCHGEFLLLDLEEAGHVLEGDEDNVTTGEDADKTVNGLADLLRAASFDVDHTRERVALERG